MGEGTYFVSEKNKLNSYCSRGAASCSVLFEQNEVIKINAFFAAIALKNELLLAELQFEIRG